MYRRLPYLWQLHHLWWERLAWLWGTNPSGIWCTGGGLISGSCTISGESDLLDSPRLNYITNWVIKKSGSRNVITLTNSRSRSRQLSRFAKNVMSRQISWSWSRLLGLKGVVKTKSRFLNLDRDFSIVQTSFLKLSRFSQPWILTFFGVETNQDPQAWIIGNKCCSSTSGKNFGPKNEGGQKNLLFYYYPF